MAITIKIDEADFLEMLVERVRHWTDDEDTIELFEEYYDHMVYGGCFEGTSRSIAEIVDNDYCNNTSIITEEEYDKAREEFIKDEIENLDKPNREAYENEDSYKEDLEDYESQVEELQEDTPTFDDLEVGEIPSGASDFLDGYYIGAKTSSAILVLY